MSFHNLLLKLASEDNNDPIEVLDEYLSSLTMVSRRAEALRYLLSEYDNGQLNVYHRFRYENDSFHWSPDTPQDDMDSQGIIDRTIDRVQRMLDNYVPDRLAQLELQLDYIKSGADSLREAKAILKDSEDRVHELAPIQVPEQITTNLPDEDVKYLRHDEAMKFLGLGSSTVYHLNARYHWAHKREGSRLNLYPQPELARYKAEVQRKAGGRDGEGVKSKENQVASKPADIVLVNKARKGKAS